MRTEPAMRTGISTTENYLSTCGDGVTGLLGLEMKTEPAMRTGIPTRPICLRMVMALLVRGDYSHENRTSHEDRNSHENCLRMVMALLVCRD